MKKKGYIYMLEMALAIMLTLVTFLSLFSNQPKKPDIEISLMKQSGFNALDALNKEGVLRELVTNSSERELESRLSELLTKSAKIETEICAEACGSTDVSEKNTVIVVDYYVSSFNEKYLGKRVRLWMWRR